MNTCSNCRWWSEGTCESDAFKVKVHVDDDSGLDVSIKTAPDFGCLAHERKLMREVFVLRSLPCDVLCGIYATEKEARDEAERRQSYQRWAKKDVKEYTVTSMDFNPYTFKS